MAELKIHAERGENTLRLSPEGELDMHLAPEFRKALHGELSSPLTDVVIDLGKVPFIDSSILATLVDGLKIARKKKATFRVENCQPAVRDTFEIARLLDSFGIK